jgi:hypothetical protein
MFNYNRSASLAITLLGAVSNFALTIQVVALWRSLKWEPESEWEASGDNWKVDGVKIIWGLVSGYFACAATVSAVGFIGIIKVNFFSHFFSSTSTNNIYRANPHSYVSTVTTQSRISLSPPFSPPSPPMRYSTLLLEPAFVRSSQDIQSSYAIC